MTISIGISRASLRWAVLNYKPLHAFALEAGWEGFVEGVSFPIEDRFKMRYSMTV